MKYSTKSEKETRAIAERFAKTLVPGSVLICTGDLGGGKTTFTKGIAAGLGLQDAVTSPTFVLMQIYKKKKSSKNKVSRLYHFDLYRMKSAQELHDLGFDDFVSDPRAISILEWGEKFPEIIPQKAIHIFFKNVGADKREITIGK
jgi:tRNA threonylcarbamoyladenosine biosynthesis protein TsaE